MELEDGSGRVFDNLWETPAHSRVIAFSWKLLLDRIPTRYNLAVRHVIQQNTSTYCVLCVGREETPINIFFATGNIQL